MPKSFKMILLEAFQELDGWRVPPGLDTVVARSWEVMQRRPSLSGDLPESMRTVKGAIPQDWSAYWKQDPVDAWLEGNTSDPPAFVINNERFEPVFKVEAGLVDTFSSLVQEIIDYRLAGYNNRTSVETDQDRVVSIGSHPSRRGVVALPYFPNLQIACGHFRTGSTDSEEHRYLGPQYGRLDPSRHFIAQAAGPSMDGGKNPIRDGDYLLLEHITPTSAGSLTGSTVVIERDDVSGDTQYLLRSILKSTTGQYILRANNPDRANYPDIPALEGYRTVARLRQVLDPLEMALGQSFMREEIPPLFGETFNTSVWQAGHIVLNEKKQIILLVTLSKRGRIEAHRYQDHWIDNSTFHWQSQNQTSPTNKRGNEIINHSNLGFQVHLFIREEKLLGGKAAPFVYYGLVDYVSHQGSNPMSVRFSLQIPRK